jgi:16S rRNA pseudouridine516 synthase
LIGEPFVKSGAQRVLPSHVVLNGAPLEFVQPLHIMLHKPVGYVCSHARDVETSKLVFDLLPPSFSERAPKLSIAGRLDRWATGLVVLSQDGALVHNVIAPQKRQGKRYIVRTIDAFRGDERAQFEAGTMTLRHESRACLPAIFEQLYVGSCVVVDFF